MTVSKVYVGERREERPGSAEARRTRGREGGGRPKFESRSCATRTVEGTDGVTRAGITAGAPQHTSWPPWRRDSVWPALNVCARDSRPVVGGRQPLGGEKSFLLPTHYSSDGGYPGILYQKASEPRPKSKRRGDCEGAALMEESTACQRRAGGAFPVDGERALAVTKTYLDEQKPCPAWSGTISRLSRCRIRETDSRKRSET